MQDDERISGIISLLRDSYQAKHHSLTYYAKFLEVSPAYLGPYLERKLTFRSAGTSRISA